MSAGLAPGLLPHGGTVGVALDVALVTARGLLPHGGTGATTPDSDGDGESVLHMCQIIII
jgi:hypothetical protein